MAKLKFQTCIDACLACAVTCENCATACLHEKDVKMLVECIDLNRQCSVVCIAASRLMAIGGYHATHLCAECAEVCDACAAECDKHAHMEHCKNCAAECRRCAAACRAMIAVAA